MRLRRRSSHDLIHLPLGSGNALSCCIRTECETFGTDNRHIGDADEAQHVNQLGLLEVRAFGARASAVEAAPATKFIDLFFF
jgi:hypothetical protein